MNTRLQTEDALGDVSVEGMPPLMPPGAYLLKFDDWETVLYHNRQPKVVLRFIVISPGPYFEQNVSRWYNALCLQGRPRRRGRFRVGHSSELLRHFVQVTDRDPRRDRLALAHLRPVLLEGMVETVTHDRQQRSIPEPLRYSVVRSLRRVDP